MSQKSATKAFIEVQFPIGPLSLESYKERDAKGAKALSSLGKWWGSKPLVLTRAIILGTVFPASDDPERWPDDLDIFLRCMTLDNAGMWKRKVKPLPASICYPHAAAEEQAELFEEVPHPQPLYRGERGEVRWRRRCHLPACAVGDFQA
ncbi:MAG: DUF1156 domain-containing protein [Gammaproteobacteria bacterium]